ncbi:phosphatase PAP2 family protein [Martelella endophytica]|uniref:phosphatase PAP2 family protein n=1 Tax=Martelella endophytica TaxID=1486262 RepID=UPI0005F188A2|nr:phosphatase PAP2 family protein [Martelella endophytica]
MPPLKAAFLLLFALWWVILAIFYLFPGLDIAASRAFFITTGCNVDAPAGKVCGHFPIAFNVSLGPLRDFFFWLPVVLGVSLIYRLILVWSEHGKTYDAALSARLKAGIVSLLLGPVLLVNVFLKEVSDRPRPRNTDVFGGLLDFRPVGDFSGACVSNCSFISGEAAGAGWLFCYALFLLPPRYTTLLMPVLIAISLISPVMRLAYGGHYLSDVILAWLSSVVIFVGTLYAFTRGHAHPTHSRQQRTLI